MPLNLLRLFPALLLLGGLCATPHSARAAESYDNCTGFIDSVPATITTQGVWCLRKDLGTAITGGAAITIAANNVTIDCNDYKLGGLGAGDGSQTDGIYGYLRQNITVRHCNVRGFYRGIVPYGGSGHLVEDNRLDNNLYIGIYLFGENSLVQRNRVFDTGGSSNGYSYGIYASADVMENTISGVFSASTDSFPRGIVANGPGTEVRHNRVRGVLASGSGSANGIVITVPYVTVDSNRVVGTGNGTGILGSHSGGVLTFCGDNTVIGFLISKTDCQNIGQ